MNFETYFLKEQALPEWECIEEIMHLLKLLDKYDTERREAYNYTTYTTPPIKTIIEKIKVYHPHYEKFYNNIRKYYYTNTKFVLDNKIIKRRDYRVYCSALQLVHTIFMTGIYTELNHYKTLQDWADYHFTGHPEKQALEEEILKNMKNNYFNNSYYANKYFNSAPILISSLKDIDIQREYYRLERGKRVNDGFLEAVFKISNSKYITDYVILSSLYKLDPRSWILLIVNPKIEGFIMDYINKRR